MQGSARIGLFKNDALGLSLSIDGQSVAAAEAAASAQAQNSVDTYEPSVAQSSGQSNATAADAPGLQNAPGLGLQSNPHLGTLSGSSVMTSSLATPTLTINQPYSASGSASSTATVAASEVANSITASTPSWTVGGSRTINNTTTGITTTTYYSRNDTAYATIATASTNVSPTTANALSLTTAFNTWSILGGDYSSDGDTPYSVPVTYNIQLVSPDGTVVASWSNLSSNTTLNWSGGSSHDAAGTYTWKAVANANGGTINNTYSGQNATTAFPTGSGWSVGPNVATNGAWSVIAQTSTNATAPIDASSQLSLNVASLTADPGATLTIQLLRPDGNIARTWNNVTAGQTLTQSASTAPAGAWRWRAQAVVPNTSPIGSYSVNVGATATWEQAVTVTQALNTLSNTQLSELSDTTIAGLGASDFGSLSTSQIVAFTPDQIGHISTATIPSLSTQFVSALTSSQFGALTTAQISQLTGSQIYYLSNAEIHALTATQIGALSASQLQAFTTQQIPVFYNRQLAALSVAQIQAFLPAQIGALTTSQLAALSPAQFTSLTSAQIGGLTPAQIASLTAGQISLLTVTEISGFTASQVPTFSNAQISDFTPAQISAFAPNATSGFSTAQLGQLSSAQFAALLPSQIGAFTSPQIASLATAQIQSLSATQLAGLTASQTPSFSASQLAIFTPAQISGFSPNAISGFTPTQLGTLSTAQWQALGSAQIQALTTAQIAALSAGEIGSLTPAQTAAFSATQAFAFSSTQLSYLKSALVVSLNNVGLTVNTNGALSYAGGSSAVNGALVAGSRGSALYVDNANGSQSAVSYTAATFNDGSFEIAATGGTTPNAFAPSIAGSAVSGGTSYVPTLAANQKLLFGTAFDSLVATADSNGDGWYYANVPGNSAFQVGYNPASGTWDVRNTVTGTGVQSAGLSGTTFWNAYQNYQSKFGDAPVVALSTNQIYIVGSPFKGLVGTDDGTGMYYATDPNDGRFQIGSNALGTVWDFRNTFTGNGVISNQLLTASHTIDTPDGPETNTYPIPATTYDRAYQAYAGAFNDAPQELAPYTYIDSGFIAGPGDGVHSFTNTAASGQLFGATGIWNDTGDSTTFAPVSGSAAAVLGGTGSIGQTLSNLATGQWYTISFSAVTTAFRQLAETSSGNQDVGRVFGSPQTISVLLDGQSIGTFNTAFLSDPSDYSTSQWQRFATQAFLGTAGSHTLTFVGLAPNGTASSATLDNVQLLQVSPPAAVSEPPGGIASQTPAQISTLSWQQLVSARDADLQALNSSQIAALTSAQLRHFFGSGINRFTPTQLSELTATQVGYLQNDQIGALSSSTLSSFSTSQLSAIADLSGFRPQQAAALDPSVIARFSSPQISTLTRDQLSALRPAQIQAITPGAWAQFSAAQISAFSAFQLAAIPDSSLALISSAALTALPGVQTGSDLHSWLIALTSLPAGAVPDAGATPLDGALFAYQQNVAGATPDFSANAITNGSFTGTAGTAADGTSLTTGNNSPDGSGLAAFVQGSGSFSTTISGLASNEDYQVSFQAAQTPNSNQTIQVRVDGVLVGQFTPGAHYTAQESDGFTITGAGAHTVSFVGAGNTNDAALISAIHIHLADAGVVLAGGALLQDGDFIAASGGAQSPTASPKPSPWIFAGASGVEGPFNAAYISSGGSVSQTVGGFENNRTYAVAFDAAQTSGSNQTLQILLDGHVIGTVTPSSQNYQLVTSSVFAPGSGSHVLSIQGIGGTGSAIITSVRILGTGFTTDRAAIANGAFDPSAGAWSYEGTAGTVTSQSSSIAAPTGTNNGYIQGGGVIRQFVSNFDVGQSYGISLRAAQSTGSSQSLQVLVDGTVVGNLTPTSQFGTYTTSVFAPSPGGHTISIKGLGGASDLALINDVQLALLPGDAIAQSASGTLSIDHVPSQDEIERLQWATLTDQSSQGAALNGGGDMLGHLPQVFNITSAALPNAGSLPFSNGWSNGSTSATQIQISPDGSLITRTTSSSDGASYALNWAGNATQPSAASTVTETTITSGSQPTSGNGFLPVSATTLAGSFAPVASTQRQPEFVASGGGAGGSSNLGGFFGFGTSVPPVLNGAYNVPLPSPIPQSVLDVLNGQNLEINVKAHAVIPAAGLIPGEYNHLFVELESGPADNRQKTTLSFEPGSTNEFFVAVPNLNGPPQIVAVPALVGQLNADVNVGDPVAILKDPQEQLTFFHQLNAPAGESLQQFGKKLVDWFFSYQHHEAYVPVLGYDSNSGVAALLKYAGNTTPINLPGPSPTRPVGFAPGFERPIPLQDFSYKLVIPGVTANLPELLANNPFIMNLVSQNGALADALGGLGAQLPVLNQLVSAYEAIHGGGVLNVVSSLLYFGADMSTVAVDGGLLPMGFLTTKGQPGYWLTHNGVGIAGSLLLGASDVNGIVQGYDEGGVQGGLYTALSVDQLLATVIGLSGGIATPVAIVAGVLAAIFGGSHDNPAAMPDKYDTARYTQYVGELQGSAGTAYAPPYNPSVDPVQQALGGLSMLKYIEQWAKENASAPNEEVRAEASSLASLYGTTGNGALSFGTDIGNEAVVGGTLSGTYISIYAQASQDIGAIEMLNASFPTAVAYPVGTASSDSNNASGTISYYA